jgi:hypothetical protein
LLDQPGIAFLLLLLAILVLLCWLLVHASECECLFCADREVVWEWRWGFWGLR